MVGVDATAIITNWRDEAGECTKDNTTVNGWAKTICKISHQKFAGPLEHSANGKLISIAPEMYEALKIIASGGKNQYQWSMTKVEALARDTISELERLLYVREKP